MPEAHEAAEPSQVHAGPALKAVAQDSPSVYVAHAGKHRRIAERLRIAAQPYGLRLLGVEDETNAAPPMCELRPPPQEPYDGVLIVRLSPDIVLEPALSQARATLAERRVRAVWQTPDLPQPSGPWNLVINEEHDPEDRQELYKVSRRLAQHLGLSGRPCWWKRVIADYRLAGPVQRLALWGAVLSFAMGVIGACFNASSLLPVPRPPDVVMDWSGDPGVPFDQNSPVPTPGITPSGDPSVMRVQVDNPGWARRAYLVVKAPDGKTAVQRLTPPWSHTWQVPLESEGAATVIAFTKLGRALTAAEEAALLEKLAPVEMRVHRSGNRVWSGAGSAFVKGATGRGGSDLPIERGAPLEHEAWADHLRDALLAIDGSVRFSGQSFPVEKNESP